MGDETHDAPAEQFGPFPAYHPADDAEIMPASDVDGIEPKARNVRRTIGGLGRELIKREAQETPGQRTLYRERQAEAIEMRLQGFRNEETAEVLGVTAATVQNYIKDARRLAIMTIGEDVRDFELIRLAQLDRTFYPLARKGDYRAADIVLRTQQNRAKLLGLNAPTRVRFEHVVQEEVARIAAEAGMDPEQLQRETDIILDGTDYEVAG